MLDMDYFVVFLGRKKTGSSTFVTHLSDLLSLALSFSSVLWLSVTRSLSSLPWLSSIFPPRLCAEGKISSVVSSESQSSPSDFRE